MGVRDALQLLIAHFGGKIHTSLELCLPSGSGYIPDIAYIDDTTGLCIDIEIDEPYSLPENSLSIVLEKITIEMNFLIAKGGL